jgi:hypothetical protein
MLVKAHTRVRVEMQCTVYAVIVPPVKRGTAYAHDRNGKCIAFTGDRAKMIALCNEVRLYNSGARSRVLVETRDWEGVVCVPRSECMAHLGLVA